MLLAISGFPYNSAWRGFVLFNCFVGVLLMQIGTLNMVKPVKWSNMNQFFTSVFFQCLPICFVSARFPRMIYLVMISKLINITPKNG